MFFYNFVTNKVIRNRSKDRLRMTPEIKRIILEKAKIYQSYVKYDRNISDHQIPRDITSRCKSAIKKAKSNYFYHLGESLNNPVTTPETY